MAVMTKAALYARIDSMRRKYGIEGALDPWEFAETHGYTISRHKFDDENVKGFLVRVKDDKKHITIKGILLNEGHTREEERCILAHELVHSELHGAFSRLYEVDSSSSSYAEYQADEGAAELLMPYREFIPKICRVKRMLAAHPSLIIGQLAREYGLDRETIRRRIKGLSYEIEQFSRGVPLEKIELKSQYERSRTEQKIPRKAAVNIDITADEDENE